MLLQDLKEMDQLTFQAGGNPLVERGDNREHPDDAEDELKNEHLSWPSSPADKRRNEEINIFFLPHHLHERFSMC